MLNRGETVGVFQLESGGMVGLCKSFDIDGIEDIIALIALYRPGPMDLIPDYIARKRGKTRIRYAHPLLKTVCADTFGIMIYQEQVMAAASVLAGYSLGNADLLRRAMGKKDLEKMQLERVKFVEGCARVNEIGEAKANEIFDLLEKFAGYGFNRSHSAAYGWVSYQTAYLKANFPVEFMAASLTHATSASDATAKIAIFVAECQRMGLKILPPDVNKSGLYFEPEDLDREDGKAERVEDCIRAARVSDARSVVDGASADPSVPSVPLDPSAPPPPPARWRALRPGRREKRRLGRRRDHPRRAQGQRPLPILRRLLPAPRPEGDEPQARRVPREVRRLRRLRRPTRGHVRARRNGDGIRPARPAREGQRPDLPLR